MLSGVEHRHRRNHDIAHAYFADLLFASRSPRHLWRPHITKPTATNSCFCPGPQPGCHQSRRRTTFVLKAIPKKNANENEEAMWGEAHIPPRRRPTLYGVSLSRPTNACVRRRYSFVTDVVLLYALIICHINDGSRHPSLLSPQLKSVMSTLRTEIHSSVMLC